MVSCSMRLCESQAGPPAMAWRIPASLSLGALGSEVSFASVDGPYRNFSIALSQCHLRASN